MKRFLTSTLIGPFQQWHLLFAIACFYAMLGIVALEWLWVNRAGITLAGTSSVFERSNRDCINPGAGVGIPSPRSGAMTLAAYKIQKPSEPTMVRVTCRMVNGRDDSPYYSIRLLPYDDDPWAWEAAGFPRTRLKASFFGRFSKAGKIKKES